MKTLGYFAIGRYRSFMLATALSTCLSPVGVAVSHAQTGNAAVSTVMIPALNARDHNLPAADGSLWRFEGPSNLLAGGHSIGTAPYSGRVNELAVDPTNPVILYATGGTGGLWKSVDQGATWAARSVGWPIQSATAVAIDPNNPNRIFVGTGDYKRRDNVEPFSVGIMRSIDGGLTWQAVADKNTEMLDYAVSRIVVDPDKNNSSNVLAATGRGSRMPGGNIFRSTDAGLTWNSLGLPDANWDDLAVCDSNIFWATATRRQSVDSDPAAGDTFGFVYKSLDHGASWTRALNLDFLAASPDVIKIGCDPKRNNGVMVAVYVAGAVRLFATYNHAISWVELTITTPAANFDVSAPWAHSAFGMTFSKVYLGGVWLANAPLASASGSLNFSFGPDIANDLQCVVPDPAETDAVYFCSDRGIFHYSPTSVPSSSSKNKTLGVTQVTRMDVHPRDGGLIGFGAQDLGQVVSFFGNGNNAAALGQPANWALISGSDGGSAAFKGDISSHVYLANTCGEVTRYDGTLITPTPAAIPACPAPGLCDLRPSDGDNCNSKSPLLYRADLDTLDWANNSLVAFTNPDAAIGPTAMPILFPTGHFAWSIQSLAACPTNSSIVYAGSQLGELFYSGDAGQTWTLAGRNGLPVSLAPIWAISPTPGNCYDVLISFGYEDTIYPPVGSSIRLGSNTFLGYLGAPGDRLFRSTNVLAGRVWTSAHGNGGTQALPFAPVSAITRHPSAPDSIWFAGTDVGVFRSDDAGAHWANATAPLGLPNTLVRDLRISADGNTLYAGTFGRGVWSMDVHRPANFFGLRGVVTIASKPVSNVSVIATGPGRITRWLKNTLTTGSIVTTAPITVPVSGTISVAAVSIEVADAETVSLRTPLGATLAMSLVPGTQSQYQLTGTSAAALVGQSTVGVDGWSFDLTGTQVFRNKVLLGRLNPSVVSASVDFTINGSLGTRTGADGEFTIEFLARGSHVVSVAQNGVQTDFSVSLDRNVTDLNCPVKPVGVFTLDPMVSQVRVKQPLTYKLAYTITDGRSWRDLSTVQLLFADDSGATDIDGPDRHHSEGTILWLQFDTIRGTFSLLDPETGVAGPDFAPGRPNRLETEWAVVDLANSKVETKVPDLSSVTLTIELRFKPDAAGRKYDVKVLAIDQLGHIQGPEFAGTLQVGKVAPVVLPPTEP